MGEFNLISRAFFKQKKKVFRWKFGQFSSISIKLTLINISWTSGEVSQDWMVLLLRASRRRRRRWRPGWWGRRSKPTRGSSSPFCSWSWWCWFCCWWCCCCCCWWWCWCWCCWWCWCPDLTWQMSLQIRVRCWGRAWAEKYYNLESSHSRPLYQSSFNIFISSQLFPVRCEEITVLQFPPIRICSLSVSLWCGVS